MQVLSWEHKHGTNLYDASTPEALNKSAIKVLKTLVEWGYIYKPSDDPDNPSKWSGIDMELAALTDDQVNDLPTQSLKDEANKHRKKLETHRRECASAQEEWDEIQKIISGEKVFAPDWVRQADSRDGVHKKGDVMPGREITAWTILQSRNGAEYEQFELEDVEGADE